MDTMPAESKNKRSKETPLTKKGFLRILERIVTTPMPSRRKKPAPEASETSAAHPSDDCNETHTNPSRTVGT